MYISSVFCILYVNIDNKTLLKSICLCSSKSFPFMLFSEKRSIRSKFTFDKKKVSVSRFCCFEFFFDFCSSTVGHHSTLFLLHAELIGPRPNCSWVRAISYANCTTMIKTTSGDCSSIFSHIVYYIGQ